MTTAKKSTQKKESLDTHLDTKKEKKKIYQTLQDVELLSTISDLPLDEDEIKKKGLVPVLAYVQSSEGRQATRDARNAARRKEKNDAVGVAQLNVEAPRRLHQSIKEFARELKAGAGLRDAILTFLYHLKINEFIQPAELRDLEDAIKIFENQKNNAPSPTHTTLL